MAERVVVFGAAGMLGRVVVRVLLETGHDVRALQRDAPNPADRFDAIRDVGSLPALLASEQFSFAINATAVLASPILETNAAARLEAVLVNSIFPVELANAAVPTGTRVIHVSTDGVFSGATARPYDENDATDAWDVYGKTKALGEISSPNAVTLRCSLIGTDPIKRRGLVEWFIGSSEGAVLRGFEDQRWNGVTTLQLSDLIGQLVNRIAFDRLRGEASILHVCPNPITTKYELLTFLNSATGGMRTIVAADSGLATPGRVLASRYHGLATFFPASGDWPALVTRLLSSR